MVIRKVANPFSPAALVISNPKGGKRMATAKRRKTTTKKRRPTTAAKTTTLKRPNPTASFGRKRRTAATGKRRVTRRRSNPGLTSGLGQTAATAVNTVLGMTALGLVTPLVPQLLGPTPIGRAAQVGGLGWVGGYGLKRLGFAKAGEAVQLGGAVLGASIVIEAYIAPLIRGLMRPAAPANGNGNGLQGMYVLPGNGNAAALPAAPPQATQRRVVSTGSGMQGAMVVPRY